MFIVTNKEKGTAQIAARPNQVIDVLANNPGTQAWQLEVGEDGTPKIGKVARLGAGKTVAEIQEFGLMVGQDEVGTHNVNRPIGDDAE